MAWHACVRREGELSQLEKANSPLQPIIQLAMKEVRRTAAVEPLCVIENAPATYTTTLSLSLSLYSRQRVKRLMHAISRLRKCAPGTVRLVGRECMSLLSVERLVAGLVIIRVWNAPTCSK